ncbi:DUF4270 domain-containing protein [Flavobacterium sp. ZT3R18]|uniref:DUF4270 domain-containing protein n=1 Tax=Flavobacterium sp. ZT3R18 TaxID=2594429 RepID=UPI00117A9048|nr:DUF4270 domain-containing protein [Flavobacterium sp. ZT3R18]TRX34118.1 DUF4270 domain-containing protein [Flavobacterium sp. ZT3R18]
MLKNSFFKIIPVFLFLVLLNSCDKEYNVIGADLIGDSSFDLVKTESVVVAYNQKISPIQSDDLAINALGSYNNPSFGTTTANFATQLNLSAVNPTIDPTAKIKSVVLTIPYFYDKTKIINTDATTGAKTYELDSIYGDVKAKMKLSVYRSGYFMRTLDPADQFLKAQKYYNNQNSDFDQVKIETSTGTPLNNDANTAQNTEFFFDPAEYSVDVITNGVTTKTLKPPAMHLNLDTKYFQEKILNAPAGSLATNALFKEYFRGLYFTVENATCLNMIDFRKGDVTIVYEETVDEKPVEKTIVLNMASNAIDPIRTVSLLTQSNVAVDYISATKDDVVADDNLYLKGGEGSMSVINLFGPDNFGPDGVTGAPNTIPDELDIMRTKKYLINEANLVFHVNSVLMKTSPIPQRIYLYDFTNNQPIVDYGDNTTVGSNAKYSKYVYGGILDKATAANGGGYFYKFRITNHVRGLVNNLSAKNVQLGVVVTEDINTYVFGDLRTPTTVFTKAPKASVMNPLGVIVYGATSNTSAVPEAKRLKMEIYYTKPN